MNKFLNAMEVLVKELVDNDVQLSDASVSFLANYESDYNASLPISGSGKFEQIFPTVGTKVNKLDVFINYNIAIDARQLYQWRREGRNVEAVTNEPGMYVFTSYDSDKHVAFKKDRNAKHAEYNERRALQKAKEALGK